MIDVATQECRGVGVHVRPSHVTQSLLSLTVLEYDDDGCQWAQTDGTCVWINLWHRFDDEVLFWTLLHEILHGMFRRPCGAELSECREHRVMQRIDSRLV